MCFIPFSFSKIIKNFLFLSLITFLLILPDLFFSIFNSFNKSFSLKNIALLFFAATVLQCINDKKIRFIFYSLLLLVYFAEFAYISYFGVAPTNYTYIWMIKEVKDGLDGSLNSLHLYYVPLCVLIPFSLIFYLDHKFANNLPHNKLSTALFALTTIFMATDINSKNGFINKISTSDLLTGLSSINKIGFIAFDALPGIAMADDTLGDFQPYSIEKINSANKINIIYIFGESANPNYMSLYGYNKNTTPFLNNFKNDPTFWYQKGYSSAVSTMFSLKMNFHLQREPENTSVYGNKNTDLFQLINNAGFSSWLIKAQSAGPESEGNIDNIIDAVKQFKIHGEEIVVDYFPNKKLLKDKNFIVYHQDIMHFTYNKHYKMHNEKWQTFKPTDNSIASKSITDYLNAINYWDHINQNIFNYAAEIAEHTKAPTYIIFMSDHGELIEGKIKGHSMLNKGVAEIPFFIKCFNCKKLDLFNDIKTPTHYRINEKVLNLIGYKLNNPNDDGKTFYINGNNLAGKDGFITLTDK